jgi:hypothetical protein
VFAINAAGAIRWISSLVGISLFIGSLEHLSILREYRLGGLYSWSVFSTQYTEPGSPALRPILGALFGYSGVRILLCCELASALWLLIPNLPISFYLVPVMGALFIKLALAYRSCYGSDGSDQMETVVLAGLLSTLCLFPSKLATLGIWFIAAQSTLAYCTSGVSKVFSRSWMSGEAAFKIFNTYTYGHRFVASFFRNFSVLSAPLCWMMVAYECLFPLCLFLPLKLALWVLCAGFFFHMFNAFVMGLNKFFWAFLSTYPALLYCNREIAAWISIH